MTAAETPIVDNHLHLDAERGRGLEAVEEFAAAGGTHLLVINQPSWKLGIQAESGEDFRPVFETTIELVEAATEILPGRAWPVLGVHPALISKLVDGWGHTPEEARDIMRAGLDVAAGYVSDGPALALKSGRPHYEVNDDVWEASNEVMRHAFRRGAEIGCAVQLHTEGGDDFSEIAEWAEKAGLLRERVVKHFCHGPIEGPIPSVTSRKEELRKAADSDEPFLMETDFLDDPDRPGAVLGPKTVPRRTEWLREEGYDDAVRRAHVETPASVYGIDTEGSVVDTEGTSR